MRYAPLREARGRSGTAGFQPAQLAAGGRIVADTLTRFGVLAG